MPNIMPIACPACKATNDIGPNCRRCKADLQLLFDLESQRQALLAQVDDALQRQSWSEALGHLATCAEIRLDAEVWQRRAVYHLLRREFGAAWAAYRRTTGV